MSQNYSPNRWIGGLPKIGIRPAIDGRYQGVRESLERVKQLPATSGYQGTTMGFGVYDHAALKGRYLVLREWRDGETVQVEL